MNKIREIFNNKNNIIVISLFLLALIVFFVLIIVKDYKDKKFNSPYTFILIGELETEIEQGTEYKEMGFIATDGINDISYDVITYGKVDTNTEGVYNLYYSLYDEVLEKNTTLHRKVTVIKGDLLVTSSIKPETFTVDPVTIELEASNKFSYAILPDNSKTKDSKIIYKVDKNGTYQFKFYTVDNKEYIKNVTISNIDKEAPKGICLIVENKAYAIAEDSGSGIKKYVFSSNNKIIYEGKETTTDIKNIKNPKVFVYDKLGNKTFMDCATENDLNTGINTNSSITLYTYGKYLYIVPKTTNNLGEFSKKTEKDVKQTYSIEGSDMCLNVARYYCRCINRCKIEEMTAKESYKVINAEEFYYPYYKSLSPMFKKIYEEIMNGRNLIVQVGANSMTSRHYVMVAGFKATVTSADNLKESDLLILDTYDGVLKPMDRDNYNGDNFRQLYYDRVRSNAGYRLGYFR